MKVVNGWDDPRILTLNGLRRRGYTPNAINDFCDYVGVTRRGNENQISYKLLEHCIKLDLDDKAFRTMCVGEPVKLIFINVDDDFKQKITINNIPKDASKGTRDIFLTKEIWVDKSDLSFSKNSWQRIFVGALVGLKYGCAALIKSIDLIDGKHIIKAEMKKIEEKKPNGFVH